MPDYRDWLQNRLPTYEKWSAVNDTTPFRVKTNTDDEVVRLLLLDDWYDTLSPILEFVRFIKSFTKLKVSLPMPHIIDYVNDLVVNLEYQGIHVVASLIGLASYLVRKSISIGKFTYETYGFGKGSFGKVPFGGGTVALEMPVCT